MLGAAHPAAPRAQVEPARELDQGLEKRARIRRGRAPGLLPQHLRVQIATTIEEPDTPAHDLRDVAAGHRAPCEPSLARSSSCSRLETPRAARSGRSPASIARTPPPSSPDTAIP